MPQPQYAPAAFLTKRNCCHCCCCDSAASTFYPRSVTRACENEDAYTTPTTGATPADDGRSEGVAVRRPGGVLRWLHASRSQRRPHVLPAGSGEICRRIINSKGNDCCLPSLKGKRIFFTHRDFHGSLHNRLWDRCCDFFPRAISIRVCSLM